MRIYGKIAELQYKLTKGRIVTRCELVSYFQMMYVIKLFLDMRKVKSPPTEYFYFEHQ